MQKNKWTFLTNHGRVFAYIARHSRTTTRKIAREVGITERAVQKIIRDLEADSYIIRNREGRNNNYEVDPGRPMRHPMHREHMVGNLLAALGCDLDSSEGPNEK